MMNLDFIRKMWIFSWSNFSLIPESLLTYMCTQSRPIVSGLMDCSLQGSSVHGILQARILEWVAVFSARESSRLKDWTCVTYISCIDRRVLYQTDLHTLYFLVPSFLLKVIAT